ncbi:MAG TPA: hypothetical protein VFV38_12220 [Ktedonobacteraceae bacterium]|nr:hypothetical protein [Ktedonobacteraceae bacterium]
MHSFYAHEVAWNGGWVGRAMVMNRNILYLYGTNIFGPELVAHVGQERLLNAPAWRREILDDGAILLVPIERFPDSRNPPRVYAEPAEARLDAVARSLGMRGLGDPDVFELEEEYEEMPDEMDE